MYTLYSQDGVKVKVKTITDKQEYVNSGFYFETPTGAKVGNQEVEEAEFTEVSEESGSEQSEEDTYREKFQAIFGRKAGNMKFDKIKSAVDNAEAEQDEE